jgi:hypothetical protein
LSQRVSEIRVRIRVGTSMLAASDDPLFLGVRGDCGREFRLEFQRGKSRRRGQEDLYVLGRPTAPSTNVDHADLNDPTQPELYADEITGVYLRKGTDPIPNVRGLGEMDDRLEITEAEVEIDAETRRNALQFVRQGPIWLGLVCGLSLELAPADGS